MDKLISFIVIFLILQNKSGCSLIKGESGSLRNTSLWLNWKDPAVPKELPDPNDHPLLPVGLYQVQQVSVHTRLGKVDPSAYVHAFGLKNSGDLPEDLIHAATILHGYAFEFIFDKGIYITPAIQFVNETRPIWYDDTFATRRSAKEIKRWLVRHSHRFKLGTYQIIDNNCFTFIKSFVKFLGGEEPKKYEKLRIWLKENKEFGKIMQTALETKTPPSLPSQIGPHRK